jgi:DNA topoisomerase-1
MEQLHHNGVLVPPKYTGTDLTITIKGEQVHLDDHQEEMAIAWAKKIGTPYVEDPVFQKNFHEDFSETLGKRIKPGEVDFSQLHNLVLLEREQRANMSREEKKALAAQRKGVREANKEKYGYAVFDGERSEIGNYTVEPSSIFMGRGEHPMRGKWKEGPRHEDITLNLSPDAPRPEGEWGQIIWDPNSIWIARWKDKLSDKMKYVWPSDSSPIKQKKEIEKFNKAVELRKYLKDIKEYIQSNLNHEDLKRRKTATVCYLIDELKFRVGDEKDDEEADTVGASTLRPEHICFNEDGTVTFDFLGKDSVRHLLTATLDEHVVDNLRHFSEQNHDSTLFDEVNSSVVSEFLDEVMEGITAKVFRTCHATEAVEDKLKSLRVSKDAPEYRKKHVATMANLEAAITCNHKRTIPKTWEQSLQRQKDRLKERKVKAKENMKKFRQRIKDTEKKHKERLERYEDKLQGDMEKLLEYQQDLEERQSNRKATKGAENRVKSKKRAIKKIRDSIEAAKVKHKERIVKLKERMETRRIRDNAMIEKQGLQIEAKELTRDYNLNTSLKSYIDPRIYYEWSSKVDFDWRKFYSKSLQKKYSWIDPEPIQGE